MQFQIPNFPVSAAARGHPPSSQFYASPPTPYPLVRPHITGAFFDVRSGSPPFSDWTVRRCWHGALSPTVEEAGRPAAHSAGWEHANVRFWSAAVSGSLRGRPQDEGPSSSSVVEGGSARVHSAATTPVPAAWSTAAARGDQPSARLRSTATTAARHPMQFAHRHHVVGAHPPLHEPF